MAQPVQALRLVLKRSFAAYYVRLQSPAIADPTEAFEACHAYLAALFEQLGSVEFMRRLDDETTLMAGEVEQDLRRGRGKTVVSDIDGVEDRLRECFEYGLSRVLMPPPPHSADEVVPSEEGSA